MVSGMANTLRGSQVKTSLLNEEQVLALCMARSRGCTFSELAIAFDISRTQAFRIVHGESWAHLTGGDRTRCTAG